MIFVGIRMPAIWRLGPAAMLLALALAGCNFMNQTVTISGIGWTDDIREKMPPVKEDHGAAYELNEGLAMLLAGRADDAAAAFNRGLKFDPQHPHLHFLNALVYHLRAAGGDTTQYELAEVGYKLALKFDPNHWLASYQLGKVYLAQHLYGRARDAFGRALRIEPDAPSAAYGLAVASYASGAPEAARAALARLPAAVRRRAPVLRAQAMTEAALGDAAAARRFLDGYRAAGTADWRAHQVARRVDSWARFHRTSDGLLAQTDPYMGPPDAAPDIAPPGAEPYMGPQDARPPIPAAPLPAPGEAGPPAAEPAAETVAPRKMVILDAVIINREKSLTSQTGVNLLSGLSLMFSGNLLDYTRSRTKDLLDPSLSTSTRQKSNSLTIELPAVTYSLNIANAQDSNNRLLARPSVLAYDRTESEIFVGTELTYTTSGDTGGYSYDKEIGLKLRATPEFLPDDHLKITVDTEYDAVAPTAAPGSFDQAVATVKTRSHVVAEVAFDQTLVIGAGSSKRTSASSNGVPVLKDIPLLKHLFNVDSDSEQETAVLILITPRRPAYLDRKSGKLIDLTAADSGSSSTANGVRTRYGGWWQPTSNTLRAMHGLDNPRVLDEFRRGDIQFLDLDDGLSMDGSENAPGPGGLVRTLVETMYF